MFKGVDKETGEMAALKKIKMEAWVSYQKHGFPITAIREIKILKALSHKNIVHMREIGTL